MPKIRAEAFNDDDDDSFETPGPRMTEVRTVLHESRDSEMRAETIHNDVAEDLTWRRPTALDAPPPRPGYVQRWVRMKIRSEHDTVNWSNKFREGYQPRSADTLPPEYRHLRGVTEGAGNHISIGGLVLCEMPEARIIAKRKHMVELNRRQELSVSQDTDNASREAARLGAPPIVRDDRVSQSRGRRPTTMAD